MRLRAASRLRSLGAVVPVRRQRTSEVVVDISIQGSSSAGSTRRVEFSKRREALLPKKNRFSFASCRSRRRCGDTRRQRPSKSRYRTRERRSLNPPKPVQANSNTEPRRPGSANCTWAPRPPSTSQWWWLRELQAITTRSVMRQSSPRSRK